MAWSSYTIKELTDKFGRGEILLPEMQRAYVWKSSQVVRLFDSLYRGYPIGTILLWQLREPVVTRPGAFSSGEHNGILTTPMILLDGQQRLTSLLRVIRGEHELYFNLQHPDVTGEDIESGDEDFGDNDDAITKRATRLSGQTFQTVTATLRRSPLWIPVKRVFDGHDFDLLTELREHTSDDQIFRKWQQRINDLQQILAYSVQIETLSPTLDYEEIADIFVRVNSGGTRLRGTDLALAQITSRWSGSLQIFEDEVNRLETEHFSFDVGFLVRSSVLCATNSSRLRSVSEIPIEDLKQGWLQAQKGIRRAVQFVRDDALIDSSSLLKSKNVFLPLVVRFGTGPDQMTDEERRAWIAWFYLAVMWSRYSRAAESSIDQDIAVLVEGNRVGSDVPRRLQEFVRQQAGRLFVEPRDLDERYGTSPRLFMLYVIARERNAVCWGTGMTLSLAAVGGDHDIQEHHIFPRAQLRAIGEGEQDNVGNIAFIRADPNRRISDSLPRDYLARIVEEYGEERIIAQCVPTEPEYWELDFYGDFLQERRRLLANAINDRLARLGVQASRD